MSNDPGSVRSSDDAFDLLVHWTNDQIAAGRGSEEIVQELIAAGIDRDSAKAFLAVGSCATVEPKTNALGGVVVNQAMAVKRIMLNLFELTTSADTANHAPLVLQFQRPDSRFVHMNFCLSMALWSSFTVIEDPKDRKALLLETERELVDFVASYRGSDGFFNGPVDRQEVAAQSHIHLQYFLEAWFALIAQTGAGMKVSLDEATSMICAMLRYVESTAPLTQEDKHRLGPLAAWIGVFLPSIDKAFNKLVTEPVAPAARAEERPTRMFESAFSWFRRK